MKVVACILSVPLLLLCTACSPVQLENNGTEPSQSQMESTAGADSPSTQPPVTESGPADIIPELPVGNTATLITKLLSDVNYNGKIQSTGEPLPPGTLPDVSLIPAADQSLVGQTVTVNLGSNQPKGSFLFRIDPVSGNGLLAVVLHADQPFYIPLLVVLEANLDFPALCQALSTGADFSATIISATNISFAEGMYAACNLDPEDLAAHEVVNIAEPSGEETTVGVWYIGSFGGQESPALFRHELAISFISADLQRNFLAFSNIFTRFSIDF